MATISNSFTGNGSTTNYSFTFEYLEQDEVKVTLDGVATTAFTFANATTLSFNSAPANGVAIYIYRDTNVDTLKATFFPGSAVKAEDLNDNFTQNNFSVQEIKSNTWDKETETLHSNETWASNDTQISTTASQEAQFRNFVQNATPSAGSYATGKFWFQPDSDKTLSVWNGSAWAAVTSGGTFTNQPKVVYVDATNGDDSADGHRISTPKQTIKAAINQINADATYGDGSIVVVAPGVYQEACPIDIQKANVSIVGTALRSCIVHPTVATEESVMFRVNSGTFIQNLTFTGMKASGSLGNTVDADLPVNQGWNVAFYPNAVIKKSPYIQSCTNFSDSEIDNSNLNVITPAGGLAGDIDSAPTGGGLLVDGSVVASNSPLRSIVCDSYTHVGLNGPGILVTNNGYAQCTSSYAFFNKYHIKCLNGGQANLAASTSDFGDESLVADGKSTTAIFTSTVDGAAASGAVSFNIAAPTAGASWHGTATRPGGTMLVTVNGNTYPVLSSTANGSGWTVTISRPDPGLRSNNLGLNGAVADGAAVSFFLRSMISSSGHTMEYVGSGTDYRALPENGGVPDDTKQIVEKNGGKVWTAITDQNGKFKIGDFFEVDQRTGFISFNIGSYVFDLVADTTPTLGGELDASSNKIINLTDPTNAQDAVTKNYVDSIGIVQYNAAVANFTGTLQNGGSNVVVDSDIGSTVQAYDAGLEYLNGLNFTNEATFKTGVNLEIGVDVQGYDADTTKNDVANTFTAEQTFNAGLSVDGAYEQTAEAVSALDIDLSTGNYFTKTINANSTFTFSNPPASGTVGSFTLELTHTSGTVAWPNGTGGQGTVRWPANSAPSLTTGKTHLFTFVTDDGGVTYRGAALRNYVN